MQASSEELAGEIGIIIVMRFATDLELIEREEHGVERKVLELVLREQRKTGASIAQHTATV